MINCLDRWEMLTELHKTPGIWIGFWLMSRRGRSLKYTDDQLLKEQKLEVRNQKQVSRPYKSIARLGHGHDRAVLEGKFRNKVQGHFSPTEWGQYYCLSRVVVNNYGWDIV